MKHCKLFRGAARALPLAFSAHALLCGAVAGCSSTGVGNPVIGNLSLAIVADDDDGDASTATAIGASDAGSAGAPDAGAVVSEPLPRGALERAVVVVGSIRWLPCAAGAAEVVQTGPFVVDLVAGETRPSLPAVAVPEGGFCGFNAALAPARAGAGLIGSSVLFSGQRADGVAFLLLADMRATLRVRPRLGEVWGSSDSKALLWALRPRRWAAPTELAALDPDETNAGRRTIVIDANRHPLLFGLIRRRLATESGVFPDDNGNGILDAEERSGGALGSATTDPEN